MPKEAAGRLRRLALDQVQPYELNLAPLYVYLRRNEKFVSVKAPLDFFTPQELDRYRTYDCFFMSPFIDLVRPYQTAARMVRKLLLWNHTDADTHQFTLPPYEMSQRVLGQVLPLWKNNFTIEPFFIVVFVNELCTSLEPDTLIKVREASVLGFDRALVYCSVTVFLALHLGYCNVEYLERIRTRLFGTTLEDGANPALFVEGDIEELALRVLQVFSSEDESVVTPPASLSIAEFANDMSRVACKMRSRVRHMRSQVRNTGFSTASVFGITGFVQE